MRRLYRKRETDEPYAPDAASAGRRTLRNAALNWLTRVDQGEAARAQFAAANNMTDSLAVLRALSHQDRPERLEVLSDFEQRWQADSLVMDKWFMMQVAHAAPDRAVATAEALTEHPDFDWKNPNRFRATLGALAGHHAAFHRADGAGYRLLADKLIALDDINPQTTARMCAAFQTWTRYDAARRDLVRAALERLQAKPNLSRDTGEMVGRILG